MDSDIKKDQNNLFENIIRMIPFGLLLVNHKQIIEYQNDIFSEIFSDNQQKFSNLSQWLNTAFPDGSYRKQVRDILLYEIPYAQNSGKRTYTATVVKNTNEEKLVQFTSLRVNQNKFLLICEDITEERKRDEQLQYAQKMEAIGSMAGGVAHEVNNILMGIQGYVSLMLLDTEPSHNNYSKMKAIETQINICSDLTEQLLERARGGRLEFKTIEPNEFIAGIAAMFGQTRKELHISEKYSTYLWAVEADTTQLGQAFQNIFANAAKILPGRGTLLVETDNIMLDESHVALHGIKSGPYVRISFSMPEAWMDELSRQQLFNPSFASKDGYKAGLGLSFAYGIIKGHEGMIDVESNHLSGTAFHIYLPASSKTPHKKKPDILSAKNRTGNETILLVDDEKVITDVTGAMLKKLGYKVLIAFDGEEAVSLYQEQGNQIDLVIMDVVMPGMGGGEAIDLIRAINPTVKVILCSGYSMNGAVKAIMDKGVETFLKKPFRMDDFSRKIREVLDS